MKENKDEKFWDRMIKKIFLKYGFRKAGREFAVEPEVGEVQVLINMVQEFIASGQVPDQKRLKICLGVLKEVRPGSFDSKAKELVKDHFPKLIRDLNTILKSGISVELKEQALNFERGLQEILKGVK